MDLKSIPVACQPAYTWLWNGSITKEEIKRQTDSMYESGIRAFYVLGEPEYFLPNRRRTYLKPDYLTEEYIDLVYYATEYAHSKGMNTWLYNEGGFPSGMACGKIRSAHPELALQEIKKVPVTLCAGQPYKPCERLISAFCDGVRIKEGAVFDSDTEIMQYAAADGDITPHRQPLRTDIAHPENIGHFLDLTHEALYKRFGSSMGSKVTLMFDDEAYMGSWTKGMEGLFFEEYGYDIADYMPYISGAKPTDSLQSARARSDYLMLCGRLVRDNYFRPMREWLNCHGMKSTGHLNCDHTAYFCSQCRYGNVMSTLREYDVPGIDVIWSQLTYPQNGKWCSDGLDFFPRFASSAAHQQGHSLCMSESFAVYGAHVVPEEMRAVVNFQAVQGISLFNFMVISYERKDARCLQYRPNFICENTGMDCLGQINNYTARLSYIFQTSRADIRTALYYPQRSICAGGQYGERAASSFEELGRMLTEKGVAFDIIDEQLVLQASVQNGKLVCENVIYESVFVPYSELEMQQVTQKLNGIGNDILPCITRRYTTTLAIKTVTDDGDSLYFAVNTSDSSVSEKITVNTRKTPYIVELESGDILKCGYERNGDSVSVQCELLRGEGIMLLFSDKDHGAKCPEKYEKATEITDLKSYISRKYTIHPTLGVQNFFFEEGESVPLGEWEKDFSGEVTYISTMPVSGEFMLDMGEVRYYAKVYVNGKKAGEATLPPYRLKLNAKSGDELKIVVANTPANVTSHAEFFTLQDIRDVGGYHAKMKIKEEQAPSGGLIGPIVLYKESEAEEYYV